MQITEQKKKKVKKKKAITESQRAKFREREREVGANTPLNPYPTVVSSSLPLRPTYCYPRYCYTSSSFTKLSTIIYMKNIN